ncbi:MAG: hypothetical protein II698_08175 [Ruminococcus sp.]|nr:hypothetical protein [Ruminococcus sp.]
MKAKLYVTRTIKIIAFLVLSAVTIGFLQEYILCHYDANRLRMDGFYIEDADTIDVALIGSSEMYSGVIPPRVYEKYGFTSYPYATASSTASAMVTQIEEIERTQHPQLIVIEINAFLYATDNEEKESSIRNYIDNVPMNWNKLEYIQNTPAVRNLGRREFIFPILKYHGVWNDYPEPLEKLKTRVTQDSRGYTLLRGFKTTAAHLKVKEKVFNDTAPTDDTKNDLEPRYEAALRNFLQHCKDVGADNLLFIRAPHVIKKETYKRFTRGNKVKDIIDEYGYTYINYERDFNMMALDPETYYYNYDHFNIYGAEKFTDYISEMLVNKFGVAPAELSDTHKAQWDESVEFYHKYYDYVDDYMKQGKNSKEMIETNDLIEKVNDFAAKKAS